MDLRADSWASGSEWVSWWDLRHPREQKAGDTWGTCRARAQSVTTEVPTVVKSFFTVLSAERLLLGVGPLYTEAIELLKKSGENFVYPVEWGCDLQTEHERYLSEKVFKKAVFVTDYPKEIKSFYMKQNPDGKTVAAVDLLVPGVGEIIGGSEREADYEKLIAAMNERKMNLDLYSDYLDLRKFGSVPHGGFGLGFERLIMYTTGMANIRDVILFPRTVGSIR